MHITHITNGHFHEGHEAGYSFCFRQTKVITLLRTFYGYYTKSQCQVTNSTITEKLFRKSQSYLSISSSQFPAGPISQHVYNHMRHHNPSCGRRLTESNNPGFVAVKKKKGKNPYEIRSLNTKPNKPKSMLLLIFIAHLHSCEESLF